MFKTILLLTLAASAAAESLIHEEALDLEVEVDGHRELFALLPGTSCPIGHKCRTRHHTAGVSPMMSSLKDNLRSPQKESWHALNNELTTTVESNDYCSRRGAMARAAGLAAGLAIATVNAPAYAAEATKVKMGSDDGQLLFSPKDIKICKGDTVTWVINKAGPHNVVFDVDAIPAGVNQEAISMDDVIGDEGDSWSMKFDVAGAYAYYCEPHRSANMNGKLTVA